MRYLRLHAYIALRLTLHRLRQAVTTWPPARDWMLAAGLTLTLGLVAIPLGLRSQFLAPTLADITWGDGLRLAARVMLVPALLEEGFWRVLLLPHPTEIVSDRKRWRLGLPMLGLFVVMHPLNAMTLYPVAFATFTNPVFLLSAALLGLICTFMYWRSGSLWVVTAMHWLVVTVWLLFLGGYHELRL
ncbi:type II CAAX prenyl endopeptidase Rce1 family protein [Nodosilinea sp. PGN35]|uniref:CPBP family glutamic-type intramembrane protease n=1 Tax=Nodosilinea sp. PGN35 TaxID=3020489 RepID=UPI0023B2E76D|nr:CPBP family glutamic-type intramembrane protease [Nodosilinea sp. TSF1-S3]MDF0369955.1 CPBP family glutamic-type intramembrane protease [Nodosilinea sp. TSF1-S3]